MGKKKEGPKKFINKFKKINAISPCGNTSGKKVSVLLCASVKRFCVTRMRDFLNAYHANFLMQSSNRFDTECWGSLIVFKGGVRGDGKGSIFCLYRTHLQDFSKIIFSRGHMTPKGT